VDAVKYLFIILICPALCWGQAFGSSASSMVLSKSIFSRTANNMAIVAICSLSSTNAEAGLFAQLSTGFGGACNGIKLVVSAGGKILAVQANGLVSQVNTSTYLVPTNVPVIIIANFAAGSPNDTATIYVNGVPQSTMVVAAANTANKTSFNKPATIGASYYSSSIGGFWNGKIYAVEVYTRSLTLPEIESISFAYPTGTHQMFSDCAYSYRGGSVRQTGSTTINGDIAPELTGNYPSYYTNGVISAASIIGNRRTK